MKRRDEEIWTEQPEGREDAAAPERGSAKRRKDTDLSEPSVRKTRRQLRKEEEAAAAAEAERAPWDDPAPASDATEKDPVFSSTDNHTQTGMQVEGAVSADAEKKKRSSTIASVLSGNILSKSEVTRAYPYMIFVACLMFLYIANIFRTQYIYREHSRLTEQVKELRAKSMTIASEKMQATRQSKIMVELERRGIPLRESLTPNKVIPNPRNDGQETNDR